MNSSFKYTKAIGTSEHHFLLSTLKIDIVALPVIGLLATSAFAAPAKAPIEAKAPGASTASIKSSQLPKATVSTHSSSPFIYRVQVNGPDGKPAANAFVLVQLPEDRITHSAPFEMRADAKGQFEFNLHAIARARGDENIIDKAAGKLAVLVHGAGLAIGRFVIHSGSNRITLERGVTAAGEIKGSSGKPLVGVRVQLYYTQAPDSDSAFAFNGIFVGNEEANTAFARSFQAQSGPNGRWVMRDLPVGGTAKFKLSDPMYRSPQEIEVYLGLDSVDPPAVAPVLVALPSARLSGKVVDSTGKPVAKAQVRAVSSDRRGSEAWGRTAADGTFMLSGLETGKVKVSVLPATPEVVPGGFPEVVVKAGRETKLAPLKLERLKQDNAITLSGLVTNATSQAPVAGVRVVVKGPFSSVLSSPSDAQGRYTVVVYPGSNTFSVSETPSGFVPSLRTRELNVPQQSATPTSTQAPDFSLEPAVSLSGFATDEAGRPAVGAVIRSVGQDSWDNSVTITDANGAWTLPYLTDKVVTDKVVTDKVVPDNKSPIPRGTFHLTTMGEWEMMEPKVVQAGRGPIQLTLRHLPRQDLTMRVVTPKGKPIAGAHLSIGVSPLGTRMGETVRTYLSNARGEIVLKNVRPGSAFTVMPHKAGYALVTQGEVKQSKPPTLNVSHVTDAVLAPLEVTMQGRVVDTQGAAVARARVAPVVGSDLRVYPLVSSQTGGKFTLGALPPNTPFSLGVARGRQWGQIEVKSNVGGAISMKTGAKPEVLITLGPPPPFVAERAVDETIQALNAWKAENGSPNENSVMLEVTDRETEAQRYNWSRFVSRVALSDSERGLQLLKNADGELNATYFKSTLRELIALNPKLAKQWAERFLTAMDPAENETSTWLLIAVALLESDPSSARKLYESYAATLTTDRTGAFHVYHYAVLSGVAAKLGSPQAQQWRIAADKALASQEKGQPLARLGEFITPLTLLNLPEAEKLVALQHPADQVRSLEMMVPLIAPRNMAAALRLLKRMEALVAEPDFPVGGGVYDSEYMPTPQESVNQARSAIVSQLLKTNPRAAYEQAKQFTEDRAHLTARRAEAAARLPRSQAIVSLKQEFELASTSLYSDAAGDMAHIAALMMPLDAKQGAALFDRARQRLKPDSTLAYGSPHLPRVAAYAFYRAPFDHAESRLLLENEWHRFYDVMKPRRERRPHGFDFGASTPNPYEEALRNVMWAMVPVDLERAREMQRAVVALKLESGPFYRNLSVWLLASKPRRAQMIFESPDSR